MQCMFMKFMHFTYLGVQQLLVNATVFKQSCYVYYLSRRTEHWIAYKEILHNALLRTYYLAREEKIYVYKII